MGSLDTALNNAISGMSKSELDTYVADNTAKVQDSLTNNFANAFGQSLKSTTMAAGNYDLLSNYVIQSNNLNTTLNDLSGQSFNNVNIAKRNADTATRTQEIKEWYYNNKLDTLFVFQLIFISLCFLAFIAFLGKLGYISNSVVGILIGILLVVNVLIIANRAVYTDKVRNKRYWNKRIYGIVGSPLPGGIAPTKCPQ
jgi:hypothetical protein